MLRYVIKRLIYMIPTLIGMSIIAFMIIQLPPGDYLSSMLASMADAGININEEQIARYREIYGLDDPLLLQYWKWISGIVLRGDFGQSFDWNKPVRELIWGRLNLTMIVSVTTQRMPVASTFAASAASASSMTRTEANSR